MSLQPQTKTSQILIAFLLFTIFVSISHAQLSVPFNPRLPEGNIKVKGDLVYVANNIVSTGSDPNVAYHGSSSNQNVTMNYVDIDGDPNTFSSSSAELNAPSCSAVIYAGLYWGGIYRDTDRDDPYKSVKFKIPGSSSYIDIGPSSDPIFEYEQIYDKDGDRDGDGSTDPGVIDVDYLSGVNMTSYLNYANVTHLLSGLADPNGEYTVANVVASTNQQNVSAGWTMVVIYENQNSTSKYISTFDGYAAMGSTYTSVNFPFSGFRTLPAPLPVNAVIGASTIDGDRVTGPSMRFRANPTDSWTYLSDAINPSNNVFNSTISNQGSWVDTRNPASHNTLGWDADILKLTNPGNSVLPNDHDSGEILISTSSEGVILFLTTVAVEIINPEILVEKKVEDLAGNDITGAGVNLGQSLEYVLRFWNRGNDDAENFTILDVLPDNVSLENVDLTDAPGTTMTTNPSNPREVTFHVPDALVTQGSNTYEIRIRVDVSDDCHDFVAACSSTINNTAFSSYDGVTSGQTGLGDASVSNVNNCGFVTVGATNFLLDDLTNCSFESEVQICGANAELTAGEGYDTYTWYRDLNANGQLDASDMVYSDSDPDNDPTTITVQETGFYLVVKESATCGTNIETTEVTRFGNTQTNPIINYFNTLNGDTDPSNDIQGEIVTCANDGSQLPKIFLCGANDTQNILLNITDAQNISWERLNEGSCSETGPDCPNNQMGCTWSQVATGNAFTANAEGRYRLVLSYAGGCNSIFYFDVFQNNLDFDYDSQDIFCSTDGFIRIQNVGSGYGFQLVDANSGSVVVPYAANNGPNFTIGTSGTYRVDFTQLDPVTGDPLDGSCVFSTEDIGIRERNLTLTLSTVPVTCNGQGSVRIQAGQARANYHYRLYFDNGSGTPGTSAGEALAQSSSDHTFSGLTEGDYVTVVTTDDGCQVTETFSIIDIPDPVVSATTTKQITCTDGIITLTATQGLPNYSYAIWKKDGVAPYNNITEIPINEFQRDTIAPGVFNFPSGENGTYQFVIVDSNNCFALSNEVTINDLGGLTLAAPTIDSEITCEGSNTGQVTMNVSGAQTPYVFSIDNWATQQTDPTFVNLSPGTYTIRVRSQDGCEDQTNFTLNDPETFKANAGISSTGTCDANGNSEVRFTNIEGGTAPYEFSFDGGSSFIADDPMDPSVRTSLLPPGNHILIARDSRGCQITLPITIDQPLPIPNFDMDLEYDCDGNGNVVLSADQTIYDYAYTINTTPSTSSTDGTFSGIAPGTYTITVEYTENDPPNPSVLLHEDFGSGPTVDSPYVFGYTYEDQVGSNTQINDFEYSITSYIVSPFGPWIRPIDHTSNGADSNGRYLVINVGTPTPTQIIYKKAIKDIIPNQDMRISFAAINLLGSGSQLDPDIYVQMRVPGTGTVIGEVQTHDIPKDRAWHDEFEFFINPGIHEELDFVLISKKSGNSGNDVAIDDILVEQIPQSCPRTMDIPVVIESGYAFGAGVLGHTDISCNGANDGSITFEVENFDATLGFEYSIDGGSNWITSITSPVTTATTLSSGTQSVIVRKADDTACSITLNQDIDEPAALSIDSTTILQNPSCNDPLGSIQATFTGGTPTYEYALEDGLGSNLVPFPNATGNTFSGLAAGDYVIIARDVNGCEARSGTITLDAPDLLAYDVDFTTCYDGGNNATIQLTVTSGNGGYLFQIDGGPWQAPSPSTSNIYTFTGLSNGTYTVNVRDALGCTDVATPVTIEPQLVVNVTATDVSSCADGSIEVTATGGLPNLEYAFVPTGDDPSGSFSTTDTFTVVAGDEGDYDVYVRDNSNNSPYCEYVETVTINPATPLTMTASPSDPQCHDGNGNMLINITSGISPYTIQIIDLDNGGASNRTDTNVLATNRTYYNLSPGNYTINITDATGCTITDTQTLNNPDELTADTLPILPSNCDPDPNLYGFEFDNYPLTLDGTLEFSGNGGLTWQTSDTFMGAAFASGTTVNPSIRTIDGSNNVICETNLPSFIMPYPLDDLDITISAIIVDCNELQVTVQGEEGLAPYEYAYSDDPANFDPTTATWIPGENIDNEGFSVPVGHGKYTWTGLVPGRTYVFYVKDDSGTDGCTRQSTVNVNNIAPPPISITSEVKPSCGGLDNGQITYSITEDTPGQLGGTFDWELFEISNPAVPVSSGTVSGFTSGDSFTVPTAPLSGLAPGTYYVEIQGAAPNNCLVGSENAILAELEPLNGTLNVLQDISCNNPGLIEVQNPTGGGGIYTYTVTGPLPLTTITITGTSDNPIEIPANSPAGTYSVEINDQFGDCPVDLGTVYLDLAPNPVIDSISVDNCSMPATVTVNSASPNIMYSIDGGTTYVNNGGVFNGIAPGTYTVAIIDDNGCSSTQSVTVHPSLKAKVQLTKLLDCTVSPDAEITISDLDGSGDYDYEIENGLGIVVARTNLPSIPFVFMATTAENYTITIYDNNTASPECSRVFNISVPNPIDPSFTATPTDISCNGASDGSISMVQTDNGITPLSYELLDAVLNPINPADYTYNATFRRFEGLAPGDYIVRATGTNSCHFDSAIIPIGEPTVIAVTIPAADVVQFGCAAGNNPDNASITVNSSSISGGTGSYVRYEFVDPSNNVAQDGNNNRLIVSNRSGGTYTINAYDNSGCVGATTVMINPFDELLNATILVDDDISCANGGETVIITAVGSLTNSSAGPHDYSFEEVSTGTTNTTGSFSGLQVGLHSFRITNVVTGCSIVRTHLVEEIPQFGIDMIEDNPVICAGDSAQYHFELTGGYSSGFTYTVYDTNGTLSNTSDDVVFGPGGSGTGTTSGNIDLPKGSYRIVVTQLDFPECTNETMVTVGGAEATLDAYITEIGNASCSNDQGRLSVAPTGGIAPYTISIPSLGLTQTGVYSYVFTGLSDGTYAIKVTDAVGCINTTLSGTIQIVDALMADINPATQILDCIGDTDGSISATLTSGGQGTVLYSLNRIENGTITSTSATQTSNTFNNLSAGTYSITILDGADCTFTTAEVEIEDPQPVRGALVISRALTCDTDAQLTLTVSGGTPFTGNVYHWSTSETGPYIAMDGGNSHVFDVTPSNTAYQYYIMDANGCEPVLSNAITVHEVAPLSVEIDQSGASINCNGDSTASISAKATGGLGSYVYGLYYDAALSSSAAPTNTNGFFGGLPQGTYYIGVTSVDCEWVSTAIDIDEPAPLMITADTANVSCMGADDGTISLSVTGGTAGYQYAISPNLNQFDDNGSFTDLAAGDYTVIVQDANGCFEVLEFTLTEPQALTTTVTTEDEVCFGSEDGVVYLDVQGGTAPYSTSLNSNADADFTEGVMSYGNLPSGTHVAFIRDANGCTIYEVFTIASGVNLAGTVDVVYECDGNLPTNYLAIQMEDASVVQELMYGLDSNDPNDLVLDPDFSNLTPGEHILTIAHSNGCIRTFDFTVENYEPLTLELSNENINEITAEALGGNPNYTFQINANDAIASSDHTFLITRTDTYTVTVTDENGCSVTQEIYMEFIDIEIPNFFTPDGDGINDRWKPKNIEIFPNITISIFDRYGRKLYRMVQDTEGWDGFYNDANLPMGDYWYIIKLNGDTDTREFIGHFTLYR